MPFLSKAVSIRSLHSAQLPWTSKEIIVFLMGLGAMFLLLGKVNATDIMPMMAKRVFKICFVFMFVLVEMIN
jgi:hypothetical protein